MVTVDVSDVKSWRAIDVCMMHACMHASKEHFLSFHNHPQPPLPPPFQRALLYGMQTWCHKSYFPLWNSSNLPSVSALIICTTSTKQFIVYIGALLLFYYRIYNNSTGTIYTGGSDGRLVAIKNRSLILIGRTGSAHSQCGTLKYNQRSIIKSWRCKQVC